MNTITFLCRMLPALLFLLVLVFYQTVYYIPPGTSTLHDTLFHTLLSRSSPLARRTNGKTAILARGMLPAYFPHSPPNAALPCEQHTHHGHRLGFLAYKRHLTYSLRGTRRGGVGMAY